jgi:hypothetical protein
MACGFLWARGAMAHFSETWICALINPQGIAWRAFFRQIPVPGWPGVVQMATFLIAFSHFPTRCATLEYNDNHSH